MDKIEETYLELLRQAVMGRETLPSLPSKGRMCSGLIGGEAERLIEAVMELAVRQGTGALVGNELLKGPTQALPHREGCALGGEADGLKGRKASIQMLCMQVMVGQERQRRALEKVWKAIEATGVKPVLLKGFGLAQLYPNPYLRQWGDADIWVGHGHYDEVTEAICKTMNVTWHHENEEVNERHYNFNTEDGLVFEIHPQTIRWVLPKEDKLYRAIEAKAMAQCETIEIEGMSYRIPERGFNQLFVFLHAWEHCTSSGTNMKQLTDLALLCQREPLPRELYEALKPLHVLEPWEVMGYAVVKLFGLKKECWTGYSDSRRVKRLGKRLCKEILHIKNPVRKSTKNRLINCFNFANAQKSDKNLNKNLNKILRKLGTLWERVKTARKIGFVSPKYGRHYLWMAIYKGVKRLKIED